MRICTIKTHLIAPNESLHELIDAYVPAMQEGDVLAITSKVISLCEGCFAPKEEISKHELIQEQADAYVLSDPSHAQGFTLTIKNRIMIPSAGVDESNGHGMYIFYPKNIQQTAIGVWSHLRKRFGIQKLGVLITDSGLLPLRRGVVGLGLGWCGFKANYSYVGKPDCCGVSMRVSSVNVLDALAAAAVFCMGEGNEQTPLAIISEAHNIEFQNEPPTPAEIAQVSIPLKEDLFAPLLESSSWIYKQSNNFNTSASEEICTQPNHA